MAFVRVGDESMPATAEQMVRLVLKGSNKTYDSLHTDYKVEDYSFTILANTFKKRTSQEWDKIGPCNDFERSTKSLQGWPHMIGLEEFCKYRGKG